MPQVFNQTRQLLRKKTEVTPLYFGRAASYKPSSFDSDKATFLLIHGYATTHSEKEKTSLLLKDININRTAVSSNSELAMNLDFDLLCLVIKYTNFDVTALLCCKLADGCATADISWLMTVPFIHHLSFICCSQCVNNSSLF